MSIKKAFIITLILTCTLLAGCSQQVYNGNVLQTSAPIATSISNATEIFTTAQSSGIIGDYSSFQGQWYSLDNLNLGINPFIVELSFRDSKTADIHITRDTQNGKNVDIKYTITLNSSGEGRINELSGTQDNRIILSKKKHEINFLVDKIVIPMDSEFLRKDDIDNIKKCMDIVEKNEKIKDSQTPNSTDNQIEPEALYIRYEGKTDATDYQYQIAVRWSKDTVIKYWYYFDPVTYKYEIIR